MSLPVPNDEILRRKKDLVSFMTKHHLTNNDIVELLNETLRPVGLRTVQAWLADMAVPSSRTPPLTLVDELQKRIAGPNRVRTGESYGRNELQD